MALLRFRKYRYLSLLLVIWPFKDAYAEAAVLPLDIMSPSALEASVSDKGQEPLALEPDAAGQVAAIAPVEAGVFHEDLMSSYALGAGDKLKITVFGEADLSGTFLVNEEGFISMPLIGGIKAKGMTITAVRNDITEKLADGYLVNPSVAIEVAEFRPVYVMGEVKLPGSYSFVADMSVRNAVAIAGGFTYRANQKSITVMRQDDQGQSYKTELGPDDKMLPGDIITIRERFF